MNYFYTIFKGVKSKQDIWQHQHLTVQATTGMSGKVKYSSAFLNLILCFIGVVAIFSLKYLADTHYSSFYLWPAFGPSPRSLSEITV